MSQLFDWLHSPSPPPPSNGGFISRVQKRAELQEKPVEGSSARRRSVSGPRGRLAGTAPSHTGAVGTDAAGVSVGLLPGGREMPSGNVELDLRRRDPATSLAPRGEDGVGAAARVGPAETERLKVARSRFKRGAKADLESPASPPPVATGPWPCDVGIQQLPSMDGAGQPPAATLAWPPRCETTSRPCSQLAFSRIRGD